LEAIDLISLAGVLALLAAVPSASVLLVVTRAAAGGLRHGAAAVAGIVVADLLFAGMALFGVAALVQTLGGAAVWLRYAAGLYLLWFGWSLWRAGAGATAVPAPNLSVVGGFAAGLLLTLGDLKAILFYASLFPAFVPVGDPGLGGFAQALLVTAVSVGGVKLAYAYLAAGRHWSVRSGRSAGLVRRLGGGVVIGAGLWLLVESS
jgi:threonine/homoserine/homoserine lactone efflux protein